MSHAIKRDRARRLSDIARYPSMFDARLAAIPDDLVAALTAKQLAAVIDGPMEASYHAGRAAQAEEWAELVS